jgi:hypothetical protein
MRLQQVLQQPELLKMSQAIHQNDLNTTQFAKVLGQSLPRQEHSRRQDKSCTSPTCYLSLSEGILHMMQLTCSDGLSHTYLKRRSAAIALLQSQVSSVSKRDYNRYCGNQNECGLEHVPDIGDKPSRTKPP